MFTELGYDATTFQCIATRADLTRPAINHYFASKKVLYREVLERTSRSLMSRAIRGARSETGLIDRLSSFIESVVQANAEDRSAGAFLVSSVRELKQHPELQLANDDSLVSSRDFLTWVVTDAVDRGELVSDSDVSSLVEMLTAIVWGVAFYAGLAGSSQQLDRVTANLRLLLADQLWQLSA